jgi:hypothetical protein
MEPAFVPAMEPTYFYRLLGRAGKGSARLSVFGRLRRFARHARELNDRERARIRAEVARIPGLMTLLMKPRNGERWSVEDRTLLRDQLRGLGTLGLYLGSLAIPGTALTLPLLAWWIDRRTERRKRAAIADKSNTEPT